MWYGAIAIIDFFDEGTPVFITNSALQTEAVINGAVPHHVVVEIDGRYYDANGGLSKKRFEKKWDLAHSFISSTKEKLEILLERGEWRKEFDKEALKDLL